MDQALFSSGIQKLKSDTVFAKNADQRILESKQNNASLKPEERQDALSLLAAETKRQFDNFWDGTNTETIYDMESGLLRTSEKTQINLSEDYEESDDVYAMEKYVAKDRIIKIQQHSSSRWQKTRQKLLNSASASYAAAAASYKKMNETGNGSFDMNKYTLAEDTIVKMMAGEAALVKAEGEKDQDEDYFLAKTELKKQQMLLNLYNKALSTAQTKEQKAQVTKKINSIKKTLSKSEKNFLFLHKEQMVHYGILDGRGDIMTSDQLKRFLAKDKSLVPSEGVKKIVDMLDSYHKLTWEEDRLKKYEISRNIKAHLAKTSFPTSLEMHAVYILRDQLENKYVMARFKNAEKREDETAQREAVIQDYEEYSAADLVEVAKENKYHGNKDFVDKIYYRYRGNVTNNDALEFGYIYGMNCSNINGYYRNKDRQLKMIREEYIDDLLTQSSVKKEIEGEVKRRSAAEPGKPKAEINKQVTKEVRERIATEKKDELDKKIETWKKKSGEVMTLMEDACESNTMKGNKRLCRMVSKEFLEYGLGIKLNKDNGEPKTLQDKVKEINQHTGTMVKDMGFMSCGNKMDNMYFRPDDVDMVMLTMLCEDGQKCYVTENFPEGEIILPPGTEYEVVGAYAHDKKGRSVGVTGTTFLNDQVMTNKDREEVFKGIEIVVKVKKNAHKQPQP